MALADRGTPTSGGADSGTTVTGTLPTGHTTGDLLIFWIWSLETISTPTGYTAITGSQFGTGAFSKASCFWKIHDGSESNPAATLGASNFYRWGMSAFSGVDQTTPIVDSDWTETTDFASDPTMPTSNAGGSTVWSLVFLGTGTNNGDPTGGWPAGWTQIWTEGISGPSFGKVNALAVNTSPGTGSIGGSTIDLTGGQGTEVVLQILIKEDAGPAPTYVFFRGTR